MKKKFSELQATKTPIQQAQLHIPVSVQLQQQHMIHHPVVSLEVPLQTVVQQPVIQPPVSVVKQEALQQHVVIQQPVVSKQETVQQLTTTWKVSPSYTQQQAIVSTPIVQNTSFVGQDNSVHYLEEIRTLKSLLQQKDTVIEKLYWEKQELATKLAVSESSNLHLSREFNELKQDKIDLRNDKMRLSEEITGIKQLELVREEQLQQKQSELEQLKKEFAEFNFSIHDSSFAQEEQAISQIIAPQHHQVNNPLLMGNTVESILLSQEEVVASNNNINDHSSIILPDNQESLLIGQSMQSIDFSLIE